MKMPILERDAWPAELRRPEVKGVFVGVCVEPKDAGIAWRRQAHAHTGDVEADAHAGWICFRSGKRMDTETVRHELAHILAGRRHGHDDVWRARLAELWGGAVPKSEWKYEKVPRAASEWCQRRFHGMCKGRDAGSGDTFWYDRSGKVERITKGRKPGPCKCGCHK